MDAQYAVESTEAAEQSSSQAVENVIAPIADAAYNEAAERVETFLNAPTYGRDDVVRTQVTVTDEPEVLYQAVFENPTGETPHRYRPIGSRDWDEHLQEVYAPLAAASAYFEQLCNNSPETAGSIVQDLESYLSSDSVTAESAQTIFDTVLGHADEAIASPAHIVYLSE